MVSSKWFFDWQSYYPNRAWVAVGWNILSLEEINEMERALCFGIDHNATITNSDLQAFRAALDADCSFTRFCKSQRRR
jgi:hypothetical protein